MLLVKNAEVYAPEYLGKKDLLICGGKIECIQDSIGELPVKCEILDAEGKILTPGFLDQHVHITGGGGEGSFHTRTPELQMSELVVYLFSKAPFFGSAKNSTMANRALP